MLPSPCAVVKTITHVPGIQEIIAFASDAPMQSDGLAPDLALLMNVKTPR